jgi:hypothetical protein
VPGRLRCGPWSITEWVAVVSVAERPDELLAEVETLVEVCPEGAVLARVDAHEGLAEALGVHPAWWYCGVAVENAAVMEDAEARLRPSFGRRPLVTGPFRLLRQAD